MLRPTRPISSLALTRLSSSKSGPDSTELAEVRPLTPWRSGFTMIEILVVIAIIAIISTILVVSLSSVGTNRQREETLTMLKKFDNAMAELTSTQAGAFKVNTLQLPTIYFPVGSGKTFTDSAYVTWIGVPANAVESQVRTARVLEYVLATNPTGKKVLDDLPPARKKVIAWKQNLFTPDPYSYAMPLDAWGNPILFVFDGLQIPTGTNVGRPFSVDLGGQNVYVGGLTNLIVNADKSYYRPTNALSPVPTPLPEDNSKDFNVRLVEAGKPTPYTPHVGPTGQVEQTLRSPDHRSFWVSAGPDGRYDTHDDNVYSFQE